MPDPTIATQLANLDGIVRYTLDTSSTPHPQLLAKWVSTRIVQTGKPGSGRAWRPDDLAAATTPAAEGFQGHWIVEYYAGQEGVQVTPFRLKIEKDGEVYKATWADMDGNHLLDGFGFEDGEGLYMRYGAPRG